MIVMDMEVGLEEGVMVERIEVMEDLEEVFEVGIVVAIEVVEVSVVVEDLETEVRLGLAFKQTPRVRA